MSTVEAILDKNKIFYSYQGADVVISCLSPDHEDNNPSLRVDKLTGICHCFSCGFKTNIYKYFGEYQSTTNIAALQLKEKIATLQAGMNLKIPKNHMLFDRDFRDIKAATYNKFGTFTTSELGLEDRLVIPIYNAQKHLYLFQARYINSGFVRSRYMFYPRKVEPEVFPYDVQPIDSSIIVVEGIMDMLNLYDKGLTNVVCIFGTRTKFSEMRDRNKETKVKEMLKHLLPFYYKSVKTIHVLMDNDKAGMEASEGFYEFESHFNINVITSLLTEGSDPGSLTQEEVTNLKEYIYGS